MAIRFYVSDLDQDDLEGFRGKYEDYLEYVESLAYIVAKYGLDVTEDFEFDFESGAIYYVV